MKLTPNLSCLDERFCNSHQVYHAYLMKAHQFIKDYNIEDEESKETFLKVFGQNDDPEDDQLNPEPAPSTLAPCTCIAAAGATEPVPSTPMAADGAIEPAPEDDLIEEDLPENDLPKQKWPYLRKYSCARRSSRRAAAANMGHHQQTP